MTMEGKDAKKMETVMHLKVPSETFYLDLVRKVIVDLAARMGFPEEDVNKIEMAVDEACANVIEHSYTEEIEKSYQLRRRDDIEKAIDLKVNISKEKIQVVIFDKGQDFEFESQGDLDLDEYLKEMEIGGLGIYVIKTFMDEVTYRNIPGVGNELKLIKHLKS